MHHRRLRSSKAQDQGSVVAAEASKSDIAARDNVGVDVAFEETARAQRVVDTHGEALSCPGPVVCRRLWVEGPVSILQLGVVQIVGVGCALRGLAGRYVGDVLVG
jgi:hypothetical protein